VDDASRLMKPSRLGVRGRALWSELSTGRTFDGATAVLVAEACRIADRLERLDGILRSKSNVWMTLAEEADDMGAVSIVMAPGLAEVRQQALALRTILAQLGVGKLGDVKSEEVSILDQLAAARKAKSDAARASDPTHSDGAGGG